MKRYIFLFSSLFCLLFVFHWYITVFSFPHHFIGNLNVSGKTEEDIRELLTQQEKKVMSVKVKSRVYQYTYRSLGIYLNQDTMVQQAFAGNKQPFPKNYALFFHDLFFKQIVYPSFIFSQDFYTKLQQQSYDFSPDEKTFITNSTNAITFNEKKELYRINLAALKQQVLLTFGAKHIVLGPSLIRLNTYHVQNDIASLNEKFDLVTNMPVTLAIDDKNKITTMKIEKADLKKLLGVSTQNDAVSFRLNEKLFDEVLKKHERLKKTPENDINITKIKQDLLALIQSRLNGEVVDTIISKISYKPNTSGDKAQKYIEIDISQQQMYLWESGKPDAQYVVSTGLYYPTPTGIFKIMNKAKNAYSDIYHVWMPYWMAIYLDPKLNAYIGIHELPYWVSGNGDQIRRPRDFLGSPHTGGCISLDIGIAQKVQDWSDIGTPVYIFN